ncbi:MAG: cobalamin-dependent protein [Spirochaetaceae bacterium]|nr:MAG: cobalamin-dependent protein [Spirochaetaceae bacterium]
MVKLTKSGSFVQPGSNRPTLGRPTALLLYPPIYDFALYDLFLKPYALLRLAAWLSRSGYCVRLVNGMDFTDPHSIAVLGRPRREARGTGKFFRQIVPAPPPVAVLQRSYARYGIVAESLERRIAAERPDIVFVSAGMTYWYPGVMEAIRMVRKIFPKVPVVLGGIYPTLCPGHATAHSEADAVIAGPAFPRLNDILRQRSLPTGEPPVDEELLLLPEANWQAGVLRLNRGCPLDCAYCSSKVVEPRFLPGKPDLLFETVREMHRRFATRSFAFYDDALLVNKERAFLPFLERISRSNLSVAFYLPNAVHLRYLDRACALSMKRARFAEVRVGFESAGLEFHTTLDNKLVTAMLADGLEHLLQAGFAPQSITAYVLAGMPGQDAGEVELSIRHAASYGIRVQLAEYAPTPGSALWSQAVRDSPFALEEEPLTHNNSILPMRWRGFSLEDLDRLKALSRTLGGRTAV